MPGNDYIMQIIGFTALYAFSFASVMALVVIILTDSGKTIDFLYLFLYSIVLCMLAQKFKLVDTIYNYSVSKLFLDISKFHLSDGELLKLTILPILTFILFGLIGSFVFQKKEIK
jgi:ABC-2 type transport system permease protein